MLVPQVIRVWSTYAETERYIMPSVLVAELWLRGYGFVWLQGFEWFQPVTKAFAEVASGFQDAPSVSLAKVGM